jgi:hypothetical protein
LAEDYSSVHGCISGDLLQSEKSIYRDLTKVEMGVIIQRIWWYISGELDNGNVAFMGPYPDEKSANADGFALFPSQNFQAHKFPTRDRARATNMWKKERAHSVGLNMALRPVKHK